MKFSNRKKAGSDWCNVQPRGLAREEAAAYCGLSVEGFDGWVKRGIVPGPIPGTRRWDLNAIDYALDKHSCLTGTLEPKISVYDQWKASREN